MTAMYPTDGTIGVKFSDRTAGTATAFAGSKFTPGQIVDGSNGSKWMYIQASAALGANDYLTIDESFQASVGTQAAILAGHTFALAAGTAFAQYDMGFVCIQARGGSVPCNVASGCAADANLYTTTTAGKLDDATSAAGGTAMTKIEGIKPVSAAAADATTAVNTILTFPRGD